MPILKQLVHSNHQSKRRSRADLTAEMISAPLGDFRHTMHVGRGGDAFGDTSFLSTRSGEAPNADAKRSSPVSKPSLLARTFRGSKRSHSVNRGDRYEYSAAAPPAGSANFVKNAISLPYLNLHEGSGRSQGTGVSDSKPADGPAAIATFDAEFDERNFGDLTELPPSLPKSGGGLKHAESMMSFHVDLGPSMLGDILSVMDKKGFEDDDLGYEEGKGSEGHGSPGHIPLIDDDGPEERRPPARPPRMMIYQQKVMVAPYSPELHTRNNHQQLDSCSVSSSGSTTEEKTPYPHHNDTDSAKYSSPRGEDEFSFMDDEDEIRV